MNCAVTGGAGFIGSHLTEALLAAGHAVTVYDRPGARYLEPVRRTGARVVVVDAFDPGHAVPRLAGCDVLYHLAWSTVPRTSNADPAADVTTNVVGSVRWLREAARAGVGRVVFASSGGAVYGIARRLPIREDHATEPLSSYGIGKLAVEKYLALFHRLSGLDYCALRIANVYGPRQPLAPGRGAIAAFLFHALRKEELVIFGDGSAVRDYVEVSDVAAALVRAGGYRGPARLFNIGSGEGQTLRDLLGILEPLLPWPVLVRYAPAPVPEVPASVLDVGRAARVLKWRPAVGLKDGLVRACQWARTAAEA